MNALLLATYRRPLLAILVFLGLFSLAFPFASRLAIDADLGALLPESFASVKDMETVKNRFGGIGYVVVTATGAPPDELKRIAAEIAGAVNDLPDVSFVDFKRPVEFFKDRALYFLDVSDLETIESRITERWKWEKRKRNPMYIDLEASAPPPLDFSDLQAKYQRANSKWISAQRADEAYYFNEDQSLIAVFIKPNMASFDLSFSKKVIAGVKARIAGIDLSSYAPTLKIETTGRYQKKIDLQAAMQGDLQKASLLALALVIAYLIIHFRRAEAIVLILAPLSLGIVGTFAFAQIVFGQLNILTAFIGAILIGLGIDHGIHLLSRYQSERQQHTDDGQVITNTFGKTGRAVIVAALTTLVTFAVLGFSSFKAFYEFGIIAAVGMLLITLAYLLFLPALLRLVSGGADRAATNLENVPSESFVSRAVLNGGNRKIFFGIVVWFVGTAAAFQVHFNYDFESLGNSALRSFQLDKQVNELLGYSQTPMIALVPDKTEERYVADALLANRERPETQSGLDFVLASSDLVPDNQQDKQHSMQKIARVLERINPAWLAADDVTKLEEFKRMVAATPFSYGDLPAELKKLFGAGQTTDPEDGIVLLFPGISLSDGDKVLNLANEIKAVQKTDGGRLIVAGESMILSDILTMVFAELPRIMAISLLGIFVILWTALRDVRMSLMCLVPALMTLSVTLGIMGAVGMELNYINVLMLPILLGISVDSGVHIVTRVMAGENLHSVINHTGFAIWGSIVTSGLGVGAMLITDHQGLNSLAQLGTTGLLVNLLVSVFILPALLDKLSNKQLLSPNIATT